MQNSRGKINPTLSLKLPTWWPENPKTQTIDQNSGIPIWGAATEQRQAPWSTGWLSCSGENYIDTSFQNTAIHRGQQKDQKSKRIEIREAPF